MELEDTNLGVLGSPAPDALGRLKAVGSDRDGELLLFLGPVLVSRGRGGDDGGDQSAGHHKALQGLEHGDHKGSLLPLRTNGNVNIILL